MGSSYRQYTEIQTYDEDCFFSRRRTNHSNSKYKFSNNNFKIKSNEGFERKTNSPAGNNKLDASTNYYNNSLNPLKNKNKNKKRLLLS